MQNYLLWCWQHSAPVVHENYLLWCWQHSTTGVHANNLVMFELEEGLHTVLATVLLDF